MQGKSGLFCKTDHANFMTFYGRGVRENSYPLVAGVYNLAVAVRMFEHSYNKLGDLMPDFVKFREKHLPPGE